MKPVRNLLIPFLFISIFACKKESFTNSSSALLRTSVDTLHFDTVFTSTGSISQFIKIYNNNDKGIQITSVKLAGGNNSFFKINADGTAGPQINNIDIASEDSVYIFVTVSINPSAANLPFIVRDSIEINYNGNKKFIQLDAYGRNAHFLRNRIITTNEIWNNDRPYVILGRLTIDTNTTLTINKGCQIYIHADAPFIVHGSLKVNGEKPDSTRVTFSGDRLDEPYRNFPGSYPGIFFSGSSTDNVLTYAVIKNAYQGIVVLDPSPGTKLTLNETIIDNAYDAGLLGINTSITAKNLLVSNCGKNIYLVKGGTYNFTHCTAATFSSLYVLHKDPILVVTNFLNENGVPVTRPLTAVFRNCIFWGEENSFFDNEVVVQIQGANSPVIFDHVLWRVKTPPSNSTITNPVNQNPEFETINTLDRIYNFRLKSTSPAINKGMNSGLILDLDGNPRPVGLPDLGAYEKQ